MKNTSEIGKHGEKVACEYLVNKKYKIIERNFQRPWGEIDIVARDRGGVLVFVEVKTMRENPFLKPEDNLTKSKLKKLQKTALLYVGTYPKYLWGSVGWRIDLVAITMNNDLTNKSSNEVISHYENIAL
mgnify:CR=1 FL=1